jgi:hypothetical protein
MDSIYLLYAALSSLSIYVALLCLFGRRAPGRRAELVFGYLGLAVAFAFLALGRAQAFGTHHGQFATFTRLAFVLYGASLVVVIVRYWWAAWRERKARSKPLGAVEHGDGGER